MMNSRESNAFRSPNSNTGRSSVKVVGQYELGPMLGEGAWGKVRLGVHKISRQEVVSSKLLTLIFNSNSSNALRLFINMLNVTFPGHQDCRQRKNKKTTYGHANQTRSKHNEANERQKSTCSFSPRSTRI